MQNDLLYYKICSESMPVVVNLYLFRVIFAKKT